MSNDPMKARWFTLADLIKTVTLVITVAGIMFGFFQTYSAQLETVKADLAAVKLEIQHLHDTKVDEQVFADEIDEVQETLHRIDVGMVRLQAKMGIEPSENGG